MWSIVVKWIVPVLSRLWFPVAAVFGALLFYNQGKKNSRNEQRIENLKKELKERKAIDETPLSTDRDTALDRLSKNGDIRD